MASWGFLTNHARALLCIAHDRRATQAELKTPLMPGRQADGAETRCLTRALKAPTQARRVVAFTCRRQPPS
jgi:hypothetical protein